MTNLGTLTVNKIQGKDVDTTGIANNKILKYNGTNWYMGDNNNNPSPGDASYCQRHRAT